MIFFAALSWANNIRWYLNWLLPESKKSSQTLFEETLSTSDKTVDVAVNADMEFCRSGDTQILLLIYKSLNLLLLFCQAIKKICWEELAFKKIKIKKEGICGGKGDFFSPRTSSRFIADCRHKDMIFNGQMIS